MSAHGTADDGLPARSVFNRMTVAPSRRRTFLGRLAMAARDHVATGAFLVMLVASAALVLFSR